MQHRLVYSVEHWLPRKQAHTTKMNVIVHATKTRIVIYTRYVGIT